MSRRARRGSALWSACALRSDRMGLGVGSQPWRMAEAVTMALLQLTPERILSWFARCACA